MEKESIKEKKFSLKTVDGCKRLLAVLLCIILLTSAIALAIQSDGGRIKIENVKFDSRGATIDGDLYYPYGTNDKSQLPAIAINHGGGCSKGVMKGFAQELARRGYVVLAYSAYGSGLSEYPMYDENGEGIEGVSGKAQGMLDAVDFLRNLHFVDKTNIAVTGHSMGGYASAWAAVLDCGYYTLNDLMINYLADSFGIAFTEEEITQDANELAAKYLNDDQMLVYNLKLKENSDWYNTRIKYCVPLGTATMAASNMARPKTVQVAGYDVQRFVQTNVCMICGRWDHNYPFLLGQKSIFEGETWPATYFQTGDSTVENTWLKVDATKDKAEELGAMESTSLSNPVIREAVEQRSTRVLITVPNVTHSGEFIFPSFTRAVLPFFEAAFEYNNGSIYGENQAISVTKVNWEVREFLNFVAGLAMVGFAVVLAALLINGKFFSTVKVDHEESEYAPFKDKKIKILYLVVTVLAACIGCFWANNTKHQIIKQSKFFPLDGTSNAAYIYLFWVGLFLLIIAAIFVLIRKKTDGDTGLKKLGIAISFKDIMKSLLLACILMIGCYATLAVIEYCFKQDYRWWMFVFTEMQPYHWGQLLRYALIFMPCYFALSIGNLYLEGDGLSKKEIPAMVWFIVIGSLGVYLNHFLNCYGLCFLSNGGTTLTILSQGTLIGGLLIFVPVSLYIMRKLYKITGSIWTGTFFLSFFNAWLFVSAIGSRSYYPGTTFIEKFLGF